jgi:hypothetical protein
LAVAVLLLAAAPLAAQQRFFIYHNEMQEADVLTVENGQLVDDTPLTERTVYINRAVDAEITIWWEYFKNRIPATAIGFPPEFEQPHSGPDGSVPGVANVQLLPDKCGIRFTIPANTAAADDSWMLNCSVEATYFYNKLGREFTHRRGLQGVVVSTKAKTEDILSRAYAK